jgi:hypothetical protein
VDVHAAIGGDGGVGGSGGNVVVLNEGLIETSGKNSSGISAQSIGGGGGDGGDVEVRTATLDDIGLSPRGPQSGGTTNEESKSFSVDVSIGAGGAGGAAGDGGEVGVTNTGSIHTRNDKAHGIFAQSIGGGGGTGGASVTDVGGGSGDTSVTVNLGLGGKGGAGGSADVVWVNNQNTVTTLGDASHGIVAQSIGGGGGLGGVSVTTPASGGSNATVNLTTTIGGRGGVGGSGSNVLVASTGRIDTSGQASYGILAQSIGGGGGNAGTSQAPDSTSTNWSLNLTLGGSGGGAGKGGAVTITNVGAISTLGNDSHGALAQSIGGGGGNAGSAHSGEAQSWKDLNIAVGAQGGTGNDGGAVVLANTGTITTHGDGSIGVLAQSIGAGGGVGGTAGIGRDGIIGIGGSGGAGGDGAAVLVMQAGAISTLGVAAQGIFAQSIGGGGGIAGNVDRGLGAGSLLGLALALAQNGGSAGDGGTVTVASQGDITTGGMGANGIFAQSVGGGGGLAGDPGTGLSFAGSVGGDGDGSIVNVNHTGDVTTQGDAAHGIFAQSVGGSNSVGGTVNIQVTGDITAHGVDSTGIFAQSTGGNGGSDITINIQTNGTVHGGSGESAGVRIEGGANNTLTNHGTITTLNGTTGVAIRGGSGNEVVENYGTLIGQVLLGGGANTWNNHPGSIMNVEMTFDLGTGNTMNNDGLLRGSGQIIGNVLNAGTISPGNSAGSLTIDGSLNLLGSANMTFDIGGRQQGTSYDFMHVTNHVQFAGSLSLSLIDNFMPSLTDVFTLMEFNSAFGVFGNIFNGGWLKTLDNLGAFQVNYTQTSLQVGSFVAANVSLKASIQRNAAGHIVLRFPGVSGNHYAVAYTTNLVGATWTAVPAPTFTFPAPAVGEWIDDGTQTGGLTGGSKFYQVKLMGTSAANTPPMIWISRNASGQPILLFAGSPGHGHVVEYTTNLQGNLWTPITSAVFAFPEPGVCQWTDDGTLTGGLNVPLRAYRVKLQLE